MRILLVGNGGREHALCWKLGQSSQVEQIFTAPGNPGTARVPKAKNVPIGADDLTALVTFASSEGVDLTVVGPEQPLADGITDRFHERDLRVFGPSQAAARIESSKRFAKELMADARVPTGGFDVLHSASEAGKYLSAARYPLVLKADGLAAGKGVRICNNRQEAQSFLHEAMELRQFGDAGLTLIAEEFLTGEESSFLVIAHGTEFVPLVGAQDHKRLLDGDEGPNTGGMGAYSPAPIFGEKEQRQAEDQVVRPVLAAMAAKGHPFSGVLYVGLMWTANGPFVLEFNCRFGDPETQAILPRLESDLAEILFSCARGHVRSIVPQWKREAALSVVLASEGYPGRPRTGMQVLGVEDASLHALVFHAGTKEENGRLMTAGGRVLAVTGLGGTLREAQRQAYAAVDRIKFDGRVFRKDIGWRALRKT